MKKRTTTTTYRMLLSVGKEAALVGRVKDTDLCREVAETLSLLEHPYPSKFSYESRKNGAIALTTNNPDTGAVEDMESYHIASIRQIADDEFEIVVALLIDKKVSRFFCLSDLLGSDFDSIKSITTSYKDDHTMIIIVVALFGDSFSLEERTWEITANNVACIAIYPEDFRDVKSQYLINLYHRGAHPFIGQPCCIIGDNSSITAETITVKEMK